ncbi:D-alanine--D-alanine ligase family protein [Granulicoccus sp. GXG6511]|uniref:D-alanine--D-alanine ligase family protein n=1 Tax=Granulicoccus sp. GXG6511 TaxID=3381351 RepID=UPI003D7E81B0
MHANTDIPTVAIVFGGDSSEHQISCLTAASVARAIDPERFRVVGIGITRSGRWVHVPVEEIRELQVEDKVLPSLSEDRLEAILHRGPDGAELVIRDGDRLIDPVRVDVALALLHGPFGEDGTIQGLFEMQGVRYVGSGVAASAIGMDKHFMKLVFSAQGLPIGPYVAISPREWETDRAAALDAVASLHFPVYVKPARGGSSMGISRVERAEDVEVAVERARDFDPKVLVEQGFVDCREIECGVLGALDGGWAAASVPAEIRMHTEDAFYDFEAKYLPDEQVSLDVPADILPDVADRVRAMAVKAFHALDGEGLARVDFFVDRTGEIWINEINTMPGFTALSMFPRMWEHSGLDYPQLITRLIELALTRPLGLR